MRKQLLRVARHCGVFDLSRQLTRKHLRILAYHGLWTTPGYQYGNHLFMERERFEHRMTWLKDSGYPVLPLDEAVRRLSNGSLPDCSVVITIDDGWTSTYTDMLPILERLGLPATAYVTTWYSQNQLPVVNVAVDYILKRAGHSAAMGPPITDRIVRLSSLSERQQALRDIAARFGVTTEEWWDSRQFHVMDAAEIRAADRRGLDIQLHTHRHRLGDELEREIADNRDWLATACGRPVGSFEHFCYPSGIYNDRAIAVLRGTGIKSATIVTPGCNAPGASPFMLRRFLDGRSVSQELFEAYLAGTLELCAVARSYLRGQTPSDVVRANQESQ
jgi:peptidoglycan/xylan/chitin deacetylase (PgdA/CDA1 family)